MEHDVLWFEVTVDYVVLMEKLDCMTDLFYYGAYFILLETALDF